MPEKTVIQKMLVKEGDTLVLVNAPKEYQPALGILPAKAAVLTEPSPSANITQVFVNSKDELAEQLVKLKPFVNPKAVLWVTFRKGTSKPKPDFNRDDVLANVRSAGYDTLTLISIDEDWSAFKIKTL